MSLLSKFTLMNFAPLRTNTCNWITLTLLGANYSQWFENTHAFFVFLSAVMTRGLKPFKWQKVNKLTFASKKGKILMIYGPSIVNCRCLIHEGCLAVIDFEYFFIYHSKYLSRRKTYPDNDSSNDMPHNLPTSRNVHHQIPYQSRLTNKYLLNKRNRQKRVVGWHFTCVVPNSLGNSLLLEPMR